MCSSKIKKLSAIIVLIIFVVSTLVGLIPINTPKAYAATTQSYYDYSVSNGSLIICSLASSQSTSNDCSSGSGKNVYTYSQSSGNKNQFKCIYNICGSPVVPGTIPSTQGGEITVSQNSCSQASITLTEVTGGASSRFSTSNTHTQTQNITINNTALLKNNLYGMNCNNTKLTSFQNTTASGTGNSTPTCVSTGVLDWIYCAAFTSMSGITNLLVNNVIEPELKTSPICISSTSIGCNAHDPTFQIWSQFRIYGDIILVIALLITIISEAMGGGLMDAYSVRKVLPRILAAAILINLSIYIVAAIVDITNIVGSGIGQIFTGPIQSAHAFKVQGNSLVGAGVLVGLVAIIGSVGLGHAGAIASSKGGSSLLDLVLVPVILIVLSILLTIIIRKAAIILLVLISPVAFALYCLPNTEKYFKRWWSLLLEMMMVFPIIMAIFGVSTVLEVILTSQTTGGGVNGAFSALIALAFTIMPLVLIPFSFKLAGDSIGRIHGAIEGTRSKASSMHQNRRKRAKENYGIALANSRQKSYAALDSRFGNTISRIPGARRSFNKRMSDTTIRQREAAAQVAESRGGKAIQHDEPTLSLVSSGATRAEAINNFTKDLTESLNNEHALAMNPYTHEVTEWQEGWSQERVNQQVQQEVRNAAATADATTGYGRAQMLYAARQRAVTGTGFSDLNAQSVAIERASGGSEALRMSLSGDINSIDKQVGRHDLAPGVKNLNDLAKLQGMVAKDPLNNDYRQQLRTALANGAEQAWASGSLYQHANDKPANIDNSIRHFSNLLNSGNEDSAKKALVFFKELRAMQPNATGDVRDRIDQALINYNPSITNVTNSLSPEAINEVNSRSRSYTPLNEAERAATTQNNNPGGGANAGGGGADTH